MYDKDPEAPGQCDPCHRYFRRLNPDLPPERYLVAKLAGLEGYLEGSARIVAAGPHGKAAVVAMAPHDHRWQQGRLASCRLLLGAIPADYDQAIDLMLGEDAL